LSKLSTSQYWAELVLSQAADGQPQPELYTLLNLHLTRLDGLNHSQGQVLAHLCQGIFHLLAAGGIAPQVHNCCLTRQPLVANLSDLQWQTGFSIQAGGAVEPTALANKASSSLYYLNGLELWLFQQLADRDLTLLVGIDRSPAILHQAWVKIERVLRQYIQHHLGSSIRSAALLTMEN
jgi:DNA repair protein RecO (recombination protein O)